MVRKEKDMSDIKIIVDTAADMPKELLEEYDIGIINFLSVFGETSYVAGEDLSNAEFYKMLKESGLHPTTAQTPYADMYDYLLEESKKHKTVIYFTISSKGSGQNHTAHMVVDEIKESDNPDADIHIFDTMSYSVYIGSAAVYAAKLIKEGFEADEIIEKCREYMDGFRAYLLVDDLKYLQKGGRITKTAAIVGSLLDIKPVLTVNDGLIEPFEKLRGKKKVIKKLVQLISESSEFDSENKEFMIVHSDETLAEEALEALRDEFGDISVVMYAEFGPIVGTHTGNGCLGIVFRRK